MFYADGHYTARRGVEEGSMTLHPLGIAHGPHPGTVEATMDQHSTNELAVMCDTFRPLAPTQEAISIEDPKYVSSWRPQIANLLAPTGEAFATVGVKA